MIDFSGPWDGYRRVNPVHLSVVAGNLVALCEGQPGGNVTIYEGSLSRPTWLNIIRPAGGGGGLGGEANASDVLLHDEDGGQAGCESRFTC